MFKDQYNEIKKTWSGSNDDKKQVNYNSLDDMMKNWMIGDKENDQGLKQVSYAPSKYRMTLIYPDANITYQAVDLNDYQSMELVLDRF